jgi:predicted TIM-barrel enzyme
MPIKYDDTGVIKPGATRNLTQEQVVEIIKCKQDIKYFANHYYKVISDAGEHVINLREFQERLLEHFVGNRHKVVMSGRQSGKCVQSQQCVEIMDTISGKIEKIEIGKFFNMIKNG